jgi:16S rRNA (guanine966-N2)-methyltransferase
MRVVAGCYRGRELRTPAGRGTRPILERVKVALFDWLGSRLAMPGHLPPLTVLDLFCGGGGLGIEALSRGARYCLFVESDPGAVACLQHNILALGLEALSKVLSLPAEAMPSTVGSSDVFDLVFLDPPYPFSRSFSSGSVLDRLLARLGGDIPVDAAALLVWRHPADCAMPKLLAGRWRLLERRVWGRMGISCFELRSQGVQ